MSNETKQKIERLKEYMIKRFVDSNTSDPKYYQGYVAGYAQAIDDALDLFEE